MSNAQSATVTTHFQTCWLQQESTQVTGSNQTNL